MDVAAMVSVGRSAADFPFDRLRLTDPEWNGSRRSKPKS